MTTRDIIQALRHAHKNEGRKFTAEDAQVFGAAADMLENLSRAKSFVVVFDDGCGIAWPMAWDSECEGAITGQIGWAPVAQFASRAAARQAIKISACHYDLLAAQGKKPANDTFAPEIRTCLRILPLKLR